MLSEKQIEWIEENMSSFDQILELNSPIFGEPFLYSSYLFYFDGTTVVLNPDRIKKKNTTSSLKKTISHITKKYSPKRIIVWGEFHKDPKKMSLGIEGYINKHRKIELQYTEMRLFGEQKLGKTTRKLVRKLKRRGFSLKMIKRSFYSSECLDLLVKTHHHIIKGQRSIGYYVLYPLAKKMVFAEVRDSNKNLVGTILVYNNSPKYICLAETGYNKKLKNASNITNALVLDRFLNKAEIISLGGSKTEGILKFKMKYFENLKKWYNYPNYWWLEFIKKGEKIKRSYWMEKMMVKK